VFIGYCLVTNIHITYFFLRGKGS